MLSTTIEPSSASHRVVVTGLGIVSCLGNTQRAVAANLQSGRSGIRFCPVMAEKGLKSQVRGYLDTDLTYKIPPKQRRFMNDGAAYAYLALLDAIQDAQLTEQAVSDPRTGLIAGSGGTSSHHIERALDLARDKGIKKIGPYAIIQTMTNSIAACLSVAVGIKGISYSLNSACATSAHSIGHAAELIRSGSQDIMFAGGGEENHWLLSGMFDAMGALSTHYNDRPALASRPFDQNRDGFVVSAGGGMLVLESLESAQRRGASIYAELTGYAANADGHAMVMPDTQGAVRCMQMAMAQDGSACQDQAPIDYINAHATSTPSGDPSELDAIIQVFPKDTPYISSTKSLTGHPLGVAGVHEAIYGLLMMKHNFLAASANIEHPDFDTESAPVLLDTKTNQTINSFLSNSFGFGGTNACLVFRKHDR